jgi:hypothetical protein
MHTWEEQTGQGCSASTTDPTSYRCNINACMTYSTRYSPWRWPPVLQALLRAAWSTGAVQIPRLDFLVPMQMTCFSQDEFRDRAPGKGHQSRNSAWLGHVDDARLRALFHITTSFYKIIGCEVNMKKSKWMSVNCAPPSDTAKASVVPNGGYFVYLGFRVHTDGHFSASRSPVDQMRSAVALLPGEEASGYWAAQFVAGTLGGFIFYYGAIATMSRATLRLLDQLSRRLLRRCGGLRPDHPSHLLTRPYNPDGFHPASVVYAAAIVHLNVRVVNSEWLVGNNERLEMLRSDPNWPKTKYACASVAPVLQQASCGELFMWATRELGQAIVQAGLPCTTEVPSAYWGEAALGLLPGTQKYEDSELPCHLWPCGTCTCNNNPHSITES